MKIYSVADFVGTWTLVSSEFRRADGQVLFPLGTGAVGLLVYDENGYMAAQLMRPNRPFLHSGVELAVLIEVAFNGYTAYYGRYTIYPEKKLVVHEVQASLLPNWVGSRQERVYEFGENGRFLTLTTLPMGTESAKMTGVLVWERVGVKRKT